MRCIVFILSLLTTRSILASLPTDDTAIVRQRVLELMIWPIKGDIPIIEQHALLYTGTLNSSCYWPDIDYADKSIVVWKTAEHMYRITTMLQALTVKGSTIHNNTKMRSAVHCALHVWLMNDWKNPNWWFNQIKIPLQATSQLLMLGDNATSLETEKIKEISYRADWWERGNDSGANLVWMIQIQLYRSLATNNVTGIEQGFKRMWQDIKVLPLGGEGIQNDWSYHFHGLQLLSGSYGVVWADNILSFVVCSNNTQYEPDQEKLLIFAKFLTKGDAWMIIGAEWDWHVIGRAISRADDECHVGFNIHSIRIVADLVQSNDTRTDLISFIDRLSGQENATLLLGNKHFYTSDYQIHRRVNWTSAIKMQSIRTQPDECINGENLKAEHNGQGVLNLFTTNTDDYHFIFPILDWQAINGITVEHDIPLEHCRGGHFLLRTLSFVGGVSDNFYGLAMMDTASHNLTAKRSWHFYDDAIIALASNLTLMTSTTAWTTLASRLLPIGQITIGFFNSTIITLTNGNYSFPYVRNGTSNVQWIHVGETDIGYLLQTQKQYSSLGIEIGIKTGNYDTIGAFNHTVTARILAIWLNHGKGPYTLDYSYMILPNVSLESMPALIKQYEEEQVFSCISTNNLFHGTMWPALKRASFVLWDNITTTFSCQSPLFQLTIQLSDAGAYLFSETASDFTVTASHPIRVHGTVKVMVDRMGSGQGCVASSDVNASNTSVTLTLPSSAELLGASVNVTCKKQNVY
jgi:chondroitin AC lyase